MVDEARESPADLTRSPFRSVLPSLVTALIILLALVGAALAAGVSPLHALVTLWAGAFGDAYAVSETLTQTVPLLFAGLGVAVAFRCGVWNIGAEGQFLVGAMAVMALLAVWQPPNAVLGIPALVMAGAGAGAVWAGLAAALRVYRCVPEVISTIMLNFIALHMFSWAIRGPLQEAAGRYPQSEEVPAILQLGRFMPPTRLHLGFLLALLALAGVQILLFRTVLGFQIRATGQNDRAARYAGIPTSRVILIAMGISGGLAGVAGAVELTGVTFRLVEPFSPGYGFTAIAVALVGGLKPYGIGAAALLFGALTVGSGALQRSAHIPSVLVSVIQAAVLFAAAWQSARGRKG
ncbi:MAG: ABC transporter permease [Armatimonadetes bacterium]|nr:ABC transporter permease [Armatimonadota bacterium]